MGTIFLVLNAFFFSCVLESVVNVGLTGMFRTIIQKSTGIVPPFLRLKSSSGYTGAVMNK